ncbi:dTDP-4-dehydrorhamnose reductase [uncultured bacterium]|nr:dTDP-4-dehydrorhamnose reductase [uncultured bacterium]
MKILLLGKNGQVGWELQRSLAPLGQVIALDARSTDYCGDFTNLEGLADTVKAIEPNVIVNAAAYTAVDKAETETELAYLVNASAVDVLANAAKQCNAWLVHYSTDYVFDGSGENAWLETDATAPLSVYGASKLAGEQAILASGCQHLIFRTSWVYAARGTNFIKTMLRLGAERDRLTVISDQIGAPTGAELLADVTAHAIRSIQSKPELLGLYHLTASGETSWHEYARFVLNFARDMGMAIKVADAAVEAIPSSSFPLPAQRPLNSRLNTDKLCASFNLTLPHWQTGVARMLTEL